MKTILYATAAVAALSAAPAFAATTISTQAESAASYAAPAGATTVLTFTGPTVSAEANPKGYTAVGGPVAGRFANTTTSGGFTFSAPGNSFYDGNGFLGVGGGSLAEIMGTQALSSISFFLGSIDSYNLVELLGATGNTVASYTGTQMNNGVTPTFPGSVGRRVTFTATGDTTYYGVRFSNTGALGSLEVDNLAFTAAVPEPATWAMMLVGFAMVGAASRYRRRSTSARFA